MNPCWNQIRPDQASHYDALLRVYGFHFRRCDHCGGQKRVLAVMTEPPVVRAILIAIGLCVRRHG